MHVRLMSDFERSQYLGTGTMFDRGVRQPIVQLSKVAGNSRIMSSRSQFFKTSGGIQSGLAHPLTVGFALASSPGVKGQSLMCGCA